MDYNFLTYNTFYSISAFRTATRLCGDFYFTMIKNRKSYALSFNNETKYRMLKNAFDSINEKNRGDILHIQDMVRYVIDDLNSEPPLVFSELTEMIPNGIYREALFAIVSDYGFWNVNIAYQYIVLFHYEEFYYLTNNCFNINKINV